jgi:hypothetical protein
VTWLFEQLFFVRLSPDVRRPRRVRSFARRRSAIRCRIGLILLSSLVGVIIGALPGLTATMASR